MSVLATSRATGATPEQLAMLDRYDQMLEASGSLQEARVLLGVLLAHSIPRACVSHLELQVRLSWPVQAPQHPPNHATAYISQHAPAFTSMHNVA